MKTDYARWEKLLKEFATSANVKPTHGNRVNILVDAPQFVPPMLAAIAESQHSVAYQFFGIEADEGGKPFAESLIAAAQRGLPTQVIFDAMEIFIRTNGRWSFLPFQPQEIREEKKATRMMIREMKRQGVAVFPYGWRYLHYRTHTKSLISDQSLAFIGGFNPTAHNYAWHELCALVAGPVAMDAQIRFNSVFEQSGRKGIPLLARSPQRDVPGGVECFSALIESHPWRGDLSLPRFLKFAIDQAQNSIWIENAYIAHRGILQHLLNAKKRGVRDIRIITPLKTNHLSILRRFWKWVPALLEAGIEVYLYPEMTHAKGILIDQTLVSLGSANLEEFSLNYANEMNLVALDPEGALAERMAKRVFEVDFAKSERVFKPQDLMKLLSLKAA